mgnify:CR=1 FL=1
MPLNEDSDFDYYSNDLPKCPHCDHEDPVNEDYEEGLMEKQCGSCGETYKVKVEVTITYTTNRRTQEEG